MAESACPRAEELRACLLVTDHDEAEDEERDTSVKLS